MISTWSLVSNFVITPVVSPTACSCGAVVKSDETTLAADTIVGDSIIPFREQWSVKAQIKMTDLTSQVKHMPIVEVTTTEMSNYPNQWVFLDEINCPGHDEPGNPHVAPTLADCVALCDGLE